MDTPLKVDKVLCNEPFSTKFLSIIIARKDFAQPSVVTTYDKVTADTNICLFCDTLISLTVPKLIMMSDIHLYTAVENDAVDACSNVTPDSTW